VLARPRSRRRPSPPSSSTPSRAPPQAVARALARCEAAAPGQLLRRRRHGRGAAPPHAGGRARAREGRATSSWSRAYGDGADALLLPLYRGGARARGPHRLAEDRGEAHAPLLRGATRGSGSSCARRPRRATCPRRWSCSATEGAVPLYAASAPSAARCSSRAPRVHRVRAPGGLEEVKIARRGKLFTFTNDYSSRARTAHLARGDRPGGRRPALLPADGLRARVGPRSTCRSS